MRAEGSLIRAPERAEEEGIAPGYMEAMHGLCISCHKKNDEKRAEYGPAFERCATCHEGMEEGAVEEMEPYVRVSTRIQ